MPGPGSKLEPIRTKESVTLKDVTLEKRLKSSETCPDQLTPSLPVAPGRLGTKGSIADPNAPPFGSKAVA